MKNCEKKRVDDLKLCLSGQFTALLLAAQHLTLIRLFLSLETLSVAIARLFAVLFYKILQPSSNKKIAVFEVGVSSRSVGFQPFRDKKTAQLLVFHFLLL